jgi:nicotinamide mononucleotide (NMN) deamidase PncC
MYHPQLSSLLVEARVRDSLARSRSQALALEAAGAVRARAARRIAAGLAVLVGTAVALSGSGMTADANARWEQNPGDPICYGSLTTSLPPAGPVNCVD